MNPAPENIDSALQLHKAGRIADAIAIYEKLLLRQPADADLLFLLGAAHIQLHQHEKALAQLDRFIALYPGNAQAHGNRGVALKNLRRLEEALANYDRAVALDPNYALAWSNRSNVLQDLKRPEEALASAEQALRIRADYAEAHNNRGNILKDLGRLEDALASYDRALAILPDYAEAHSNRGALLQFLRRLEEAEASYDAAIRIAPDYARAHANKAVLLLLTGRYAEGWPLYEWRFADEPADAKPVWRGEDIKTRRLLVRAEQGFGDAIQFCRYVPLVSAGETIVEMSAALLPLMATLQCEAQFVARGEVPSDFDVSCRLLSLPLIFQTTLETIPAPVPYLFADKAKVRNWEQRLGPKQKFRIGLAWSGSETDINRRVGLEALLALADLPVELHSLQKEYRQQDRALLDRTPALHQHQDNLHDFSDTAALIQCMDLVISVDTAVAHLAGAMGKPLWVLLHAVPDHRWLLDRTDSPWYPTATLYRQDATRNWRSMMDRLVEDLKNLISR